MTSIEDSPIESPDCLAWVYVPEAKYKRVEDVLAVQKDETLEFSHVTESHLGGLPWFALCKEENSSIFSGIPCPKCNTKEQMTLVAQLYVPLEGVDRVTYVLGCNAYNCTYFCAQRFSSETGLKYSSKASEVFAVEDDWIPTNPKSHEKAETCHQTLYLDASRPYLPFTSLLQEREVDLYEDYLQRTRVDTKKSLEKASDFHEGTSRVDTTKCEECNDDSILLDYLNYSQIYPNQVVRWCPKSKPILVCSSQDVQTFSSNETRSVLLKLPEDKQDFLSDSSYFHKNVPRCETCGCPRHFEFQIFSTAVYLMGSGYGKWYMNDSMASMGTLLVFSCLNPSCGLDTYSSEYIAYQSGI